MDLILGHPPKRQRQPGLEASHSATHVYRWCSPSGMLRIKPTIYKTMSVMRAIYLFLMLVCWARATPVYFASVANQALKLQGGISIGPDLSVQAVRELEVQVRRFF
jgi:hypothetical protein